MDISVLQNELLTDPLARGYAGMTNQQAADSLNAVNRLPVREIIDTWEILEATVTTEWTALSAAEKQRYQTIVSAGRINVKGTNVRAVLLAMFGAGTTTRANLAALQTGPAISRATEINWPFVGAHHVAEARA